MWWLKSKTFWAGIAAIAAALAGYFGGEASLVDTLQLVFTALIGIFLRSGVEGMMRRE
jgi:hypothetical protein